MRVVLGLFAVVGVPFAEVRAEDVTAADVSEMLEQLSDPSYEVREAAVEALRRLGPEHAWMLDAARERTESLEVRRRLDRVRSALWGPGLVLRLPLRGNARDASRYRRHGETDTQGQPWKGDGLSLDTTRGPTFVRVADAPHLDTDRAFTLAAWIRPSRIDYVRLPEHAGEPGEPVYPWGEGLARWHGHFILAKWRSANLHGDYLFAVTPSGQLGLGVANRSRRFQCDAVRTERRIPVDTWTHVAATFDDGTMRLFVNGKPAASKTSTKVRFTATEEYGQDDLYVGRLWADGYQFHGGLREVFVFNQALADERVARLAESTKPR